MDDGYDDDDDDVVNNNQWLFLSQVTLSWKPAVSFGEATIVGYRLLRDGTASCDDLGCERRSVTINALEEG